MSDISENVCTALVCRTTQTSPPVPLCVDLDGTLIRTDALLEGLLAILSSYRGWTRLPLLMTTSRARLKHRVGSLAQLDPALLPYNEALLVHLREQRATGRRIVLATAADYLVADAVADHLCLFDEVICSDGLRNLKGDAKARALIARFGIGGFAYVGNGRDDLPAWQAARSATIVDASPAVRAQVHASKPVDAEFQSRPSLFRPALRAMRPHQWAKNLLVFVPMIMAHAIATPAAWGKAVCMFFAFCATASGIYLINDLADLSADRRHPRKRNRPLASGAITLRAGTILAVCMLAIGIGIGAAIGAPLIIGLYATASLSYSLGLKEFPIVDIFILAALYTIRMLGGGVATGHLISMWLLAFSGFLFLALALVKRTEEMTAVARSVGERVVSRRGYFPGDAQILQTFGCVSSFASSVVLALFVGSDSAIRNYETPVLLWGIVPLILFWQCRLWLSTARGHMHDDPIVYATRDWVSWLVAACAIALVAGATIGVDLSPLGIVQK